jgi:hypothetical protein
MTSILEAIEHVGEEVVDEAKDLVHDLGGFIQSEAQKVIAAAANTNFGTKILNLMSLAQSKGGLSGADKLKAVIAAALDAAEQFLAIGGWSGVFAAVKDFVAGVVQMLYADFIKAFAPKAA